MGYNRVRTPRFYIDVSNILRAKGGIYSYQPTIVEDNMIPWVSASDMFHNNGTKVWKTDMFEGWQHNGAEASIDVTCEWADNTETFTNTFWQTDLYMKFAQYYPLGNINYMAFLGHNLGPSLTMVQPFICRSNNDGIQTHLGDGTAVPPLYLTDVIDDMDAENHFFGTVQHNGNGILEFFRFVGHGDLNDVDSEFSCSIDGIDNEPDCLDAGGDWLPVTRDQDENLAYTSAQIGWNVIRFNDNNKTTDTFHQIWNKLGDGNMINNYNTMGLRMYKYDGEATQNGYNTVWRKCPHINSFSCGWTYVMEKTPDLELEMSWEFDGIKTKTGLGGQNITQIDYDGPAGWEFLRRTYNSENEVSNSVNIDTNTAWAQHSSNLGQNYDAFGGQVGRRVWKLKFSYMHDKLDNSDNSIYGSDQLHNRGLFNDNQHRESKVHLEWGSSSHGTAGDGFIGLNQNFFSRVIQGTMGGKLPFLFQPDSTDNDEIYLCEFEGNEISFEQVAPNVYNFDLTIREVW